jgi:SAM-dependent methyltransferase
MSSLIKVFGVLVVAVATSLIRYDFGKRAKEKSLPQAIWDFIGIPFRLVLFDQNWLPKFGWTTLEEERINIVLPLIKGRLLDVGAGPNTLVNRYHPLSKRPSNDNVGVDVFDWGGGVQVVANTAQLDYADKSFDSIAYVACLNHIPYRADSLRESRRLITDDGVLIITMINPLLGDFGHAIWWYSEDKHRGGMIEGELGGMWKDHIVQLCQDAGFRLVEHRQFVYGMNNLYIFAPIQKG